MTDGNTAAEAVAAMDANADLQKQIAELAARLAVYEQDNVSRPVFNGEVPKYKLLALCYLDDALCEEGMEIEWMGAPNMEMVPLNDAARKRMQQYVDELTEAARQRADRRGTQFVGLVNDRGVLLAEADQDARRAPTQVIAMPTERDGPVVAMPHTAEAQAQAKRRGRPPTKNLASVKAPAPVKKPGGDPGNVLGKDRYSGLGGGN